MKLKLITFITLVTLLTGCGSTDILPSSSTTDLNEILTYDVTFLDYDGSLIKQNQ